MNSKKDERIYPKTYSLELLRIAEGDLESAKSLQHATGRKENIVYMAQQSVEKSLKAVLCFNERSIPFIHDIGALVGLLTAIDETPPGGFDLADLTPFASIRRYQEGSAELDKDDIAGAIQMAVDVLKWAKGAIHE